MILNVIGIDPSLNNMGFAKARVNTETYKIEVIDLILAETAPDKKSAKVVRKNSDDLARAKLLHDALQRETAGCSFAFVEIPVGSQSSRAMASYGICIGVLASCKLPLIQVTPTEVKLAGYGTKTATKQDMINWAVKKYPNANWLTRKLKGEIVLMNDNEHLADAVAAIEAGISTDQFMRSLSFFNAVTKEAVE